MPKLIVLSFVILGFAFYEMSGGSDFVPRSAAIKAEIAKNEALKNQQSNAARVAKADTAGKIPDRAEVEVTQLVATPAVARQQEQPAKTTTPERNATAARFVGARQTASSDQVVLASLERGSTSFGNVLNINLPNSDQDAVQPEQVETVRAEPEPQTDIREVTASRVNVRTGPSTNFDVLTKVKRGQKVEVLGDNGDGWLRLRLLPEDRVGWIAARLISPAG